MDLFLWIKAANLMDIPGNKRIRERNSWGKPWAGGKKKWQTEYRTAQPPTLASFQTWGSSVGAGRTDLPLQR
jgi:hypothetical protein